jgi:hypothetical protein
VEWRRQRSPRAKILLIAGVVFALFAILAVACGGDNGDSGGANPPAAAPEPEPEPTPPPPPPLEEQVTEVGNDELGEDGPGDLPRIRSVDCIARRCTVEYNVDTPFSRPEREIMADQTGVFDRLLNDLKLPAATLVPFGEVTSVGGKKSREAVMRIKCDQAANAQIDWENVDNDGMKALCTYIPLIDF